MNRLLKKTSRNVRNYFTLHVETSTLREKTTKRLQFSFEYVLLLIASVVISTLGLLMDSSVIVIGGMLVSPLIIPILSMSVGIYDGDIRVMRKSLLMIVVSVALILGVTMLITELSPLKNMTNEISGRANPTLLDLFIALAGGLIGIMAISHRKIADSFAGVSIATSLLPPLSVAGIGISFADTTLFYGGFLLFLLNLLAITFIGTVYLTAQHWLARDKSHISIKTLATIGLSLLLLVMPLTYQLREYSNTLTMQKNARETIEQALAAQHPQARINRIDASKNTTENQNSIIVQADITIDEDDAISYQLQRGLTQTLEHTLGQDVQLQFTVQRSVGVITEEQAAHTRDVKQFSDAFSKALASAHPDVTITNITLEPAKDSYNLLATIHLSGAPNAAPSSQSLRTIKTAISDSLSGYTEYNVIYTPIITIAP